MTLDDISLLSFSDRFNGGGFLLFLALTEGGRRKARSLTEGSGLGFEMGGLICCIVL